MRWRLLVRLAALGDADAVELDAALAEEPTNAATVAHAQARASQPTAEAKEWAWDRFVGTVDVPNYELEATGHGLWAGAPSEVTRPYVARYVADLPGTSKVRSGWVLALSAEAFFPAAFLDDESHALVRELVDSGVLEPAVQRRVLDAVDDLERMRRIRAAFPT